MVLTLGSTSQSGSGDGADGGNQYYFRGTSRGYQGNPNIRTAGPTSTSTSPAIATAFASNASQFGPGVIYIATDADLAGISIAETGNVFAELEAEVGFNISPLEFADLASMEVSVSDARAILAEMGINVSYNLKTGDMNDFLRGLPSLSPEQVLQFIQGVLDLDEP